jgi:hypothetical protein
VVSELRDDVVQVVVLDVLLLSGGESCHVPDEQFAQSQYFPILDLFCLHDGVDLVEEVILEIAQHLIGGVFVVDARKHEAEEQALRDILLLEDDPEPLDVVTDKVDQLVTR